MEEWKNEEETSVGPPARKNAPIFGLEASRRRVLFFVVL